MKHFTCILLFLLLGAPTPAQEEGVGGYKGESGGCGGAEGV